MPDPTPARGVLLTLVAAEINEGVERLAARLDGQVSHDLLGFKVVPDTVAAQLLVEHAALQRAQQAELEQARAQSDRRRAQAAAHVYATRARVRALAEDQARLRD